MLTRRSLVVLGSAIAVVRPPEAFAAGAGQVIELTGKAVAVAASAERPLAVGAAIAVNDLVETAPASRLALQLGTDTFINLGPATKLRIEPHLLDVGGSFELIDGSVLIEHVRAPGREPHKAELKSPYGLIAVRGTRFFAGPSQGRFAVFVAEGRVDVSARNRTVTLEPGRGSDIARPGAAPTPAARWQAARIRAAYVLTTGGPAPPPRQPR